MKIQQITTRVPADLYQRFERARIDRSNNQSESAFSIALMKRYFENPPFTKEERIEVLRAKIAGLSTHLEELQKQIVAIANK